MKARDLVVETWSALDANRGRSALTILGIVIGIGAVIAMTALIGGVNRALVGELGLGQARIVYMGVYSDNASIKLEDTQRIEADLPDYEFVTGTAWGSAEVASETKKANATLQGVESEYFTATDTKFLRGRPFAESEVTSASMSIILDENSVRTLFGSADADVVGKTVRVGNNDCTIVGVVENSQGGMQDKDSVSGFMPITTMQQRITGNNEVSQVIGYATEDANLETLVKKTKDYLATLYAVPAEKVEDSVYVYSVQSMIESVNATMGAFSLLMTAVAGVSLLVGGIGIMNMMLTNVTERIREIGLRKALGARRSDITRQFMLESVCLCLSGGLIGVVLGYLGAFALTGLASSIILDSGTKMAPYVDGGTVLMATVICVVTGLVFGWYPARRAARLDPVESLHYQ